MLRWLLANPPHGNILSTNCLRQDPDERLPQLAYSEFHRSVETLRDAGYIASDDGKFSTGGRTSWARFIVTGAGKQALGLWPRFDAFGAPGELAAILEALADNAPSEEQASNLQRAASAVRRTAPGVLRSLAEAGLSAAARHVLGI